MFAFNKTKSHKQPDRETPGRQLHFVSGLQLELCSLSPRICGSSERTIKTVVQLSQAQNNNSEDLFKDRNRYTDVLHSHAAYGLKIY